MSWDLFFGLVSNLRSRKKEIQTDPKPQAAQAHLEVFASQAQCWDRWCWCKSSSRAWCSSQCPGTPASWLEHRKFAWSPVLQRIPGMVNWPTLLWKSTIFPWGKHTISMAIFHSYCPLPESESPKCYDVPPWNSTWNKNSHGHFKGQKIFKAFHIPQITWLPRVGDESDSIHLLHPMIPGLAWSIQVHDC